MNQDNRSQVIWLVERELKGWKAVYRDEDGERVFDYFSRPGGIRVGIYFDSYRGRIEVLVDSNFSVNLFSDRDSRGAGIYLMRKSIDIDFLKGKTFRGFSWDKAGDLEVAKKLAGRIAKSEVWGVAIEAYPYFLVEITKMEDRAHREMMAYVLAQKLGAVTSLYPKASGDSVSVTLDLPVGEAWVQGVLKFLEATFPKVD